MNENTLYKPSSQDVCLETVPSMIFLMVDGEGDPNGPAFQEAVTLLYSLSYTIKMMPKKGIIPSGYEPYKVFPLEGLWSVAEGSLFSFELSRDLWRWTAMIRQPDFVTQEVLKSAMDIYAQKNKGTLHASRIRLDRLDEGLAVQALHVGPYATEPETLNQMDEYCLANGFKMKGAHHEIYMSDPRRTDPIMMKTILRHSVEKI